MDKLLQKLETYILYTVVFLLPIAVLGISPNPFEPIKLTILSFGVALALLVRAIRVITTRRLEFSVGTFDFPIALLAVSYVVSTILRTPNKMEALFLPGTATALVSGALLYFLLNQLDEKAKKTAGMLLYFSGVVFSAVVLLAFSKVLGSIPQLPAYMRAVNFNPAAGYLPAGIFLVTVLPLGIMLLMSEKIVSRRAFLGVSTAIVILALVVSIFNMLPGKPFSPRFPSTSVSWGVAIDALKESPIFGVGPGNYLTAFSRFRPISYNASELWPVKFATANNFALTALTEVGLLGIAGLILLVLTVYRMIRDKIRGKSQAAGTSSAKLLTENTPLISVTLLIILMAIFPATILIIALFFILLSFLSGAKKTSLNLGSSASDSVASGPAGATSAISSRLPALLVTLPIIVFVLFFFVRAGRVLSAEITFKRSLDALTQNQAQETYDLMRAAIRTNPRVDRYHASFAQVNLALANAIALRAAGPERPAGVEGPAASQISDQDRANISQLVQQSIAEGKSTVALNPFRAANWELLARIYQAIIPFAQGADTFAIQTMSQAVALDPLNPNLRIALGGIHYGQANYDTAIRVFELAVAAKPDHANAHYNLAIALRDSGDIEGAIAQMTVVLSLLTADSNDYQTARGVLEDLESRRAAAAAPTGEELTPPQPAEEPVLKPPLSLPEESEPPESPITPTPTPEIGEEEQGSFNLTPTPTP